MALYVCYIVAMDIVRPRNWVPMEGLDTMQGIQQLICLFNKNGIRSLDPHHYINVVDDKISVAVLSDNGTGTTLYSMDPISLVLEHSRHLY